MVTPPLWLRILYPGAIWSFPDKEKAIYLTFDDGPTPGVSNVVLDILKDYNVQATFFCIGENVIKFPELFSRILAEGHGIGNHTHTHPNSWKVSTKTFLDDVNLAASVIPSSLFRPPYGKLTPGTLFRLRREYQIIMWDVISCDFDDKVKAGQVYRNVTDNAGPGSVIVLHDSLKAAPRMLKVLPDILKFYISNGYVMKAIQGSLAT